MDLSLPAALDVVTFIAGGYRVAVEAGQVRSQLPADHAIAVASAEQLLGLPEREPRDDGACHILLMKHASEDFAVMVSGPVELLRLDIEAVYPLPALMAARNTLAGLLGLAIGAEGVVLLVDFRFARQ